MIENFIFNFYVLENNQKKPWMQWLSWLERRSTTKVLRVRIPSPGANNP